VHNLDCRRITGCRLAQSDILVAAGRENFRREGVGDRGIKKKGGFLLSARKRLGRAGGLLGAWGVVAIQKRSAGGRPRKKKMIAKKKKRKGGRSESPAPGLMRTEIIVGLPGK